ncbi:MAG TPA: NACHT domain-containing protein, partial [Methanocorpusculum sp.]|nr:NACHT domain-containing protein [Methanocorpusculum sp.]
LDGPQTDVIALAAKLTAADVAANFQPVISLLNEDKKRAAVSALQHLIKSDDSLEMGHRDLFIKCMHNTAARVACLKEVELSSFFAGLFLYTVLTNENAAGPESLEEIKRPGFIDRFESSAISLKFESESPESYTVDIPKIHTYLQKLKDKYNNLPTILHKEAFTPFRDYYVPNNVEWHERIPGKGYSIRILSNVTLENLITLSRFLFLSGTGGLGKSMMMRNLLLTAVDEYDSLGLIPLFIPLKDYSADCPTLSAHIFETVKNLWPELNMELLEQLLSSGKALLLFDGLDEITMRNLPLFTKQLNAFMDRFSTNTFIVSSRPYSNFQSFTRYTVLYLKPLTKEQALSMVDRFNYRADSPKMQSQFRALLNTVLYISHTEFVGNPLLLSIMLLTYEMDAEVPMQKYIFFQEAYAVLSRRHDATKDGYHRELRTGWSANDFAKYFSFFCAVSYSNGKVSFNEADLETYFRMMDDKYHLTPVDVDDFIFDATNNLCLMFQDGLNYGFIHRSFQEYFCARFFHNQLDTDLERVIPIFNRRELNKKLRMQTAIKRGLLPKNEEHKYYFPASSFMDDDLKADPSLELSYIVAPPQMELYEKISTQIFSIYSKYVSPEDIVVYSIDECFIDATHYLSTYHMTAQELAITMIRDVLYTTSITATAGIGTNLYLAKVAMDIVAKHAKPDKDGVRMAELNEQSYRELLWCHRPLTDFWRVGKGIAKRMEELGLFTMGDIARQSVINEAPIYDALGINAELLIDHAWGWEPTDIKTIKEYKPETNSVSSGQVLMEPYDFEKGKLIVREMSELLALDLVRKNVVTKKITLTIGYDRESLRCEYQGKTLKDSKFVIAKNGEPYTGEVVKDYYGRPVPKSAHGTYNLDIWTASTRKIIEGML